MKASLKLLQVSIQNVLKLTENLTTKQLNTIPEGFNNNLIWTIAHLLVTQKLLIYGLSNTPLNLEDDFIENYQKGSKPTSHISEEECNIIKTLFASQFTTLITDLENNLFKEFKNYPTSYNFEITNLNEALAFNNLHYGLHVSSIFKLIKLVK